MRKLIDYSKDGRINGMMNNNDMLIVGRRIRLIYTDHKNTKLKYGDVGTITDVLLLPEGNGLIGINWDNGSRLPMIEGYDEYEILDVARNDD